MASENNPTIQNDTLSNQLPNSYLLPVPPKGTTATSDEDSADRENTDRENTGRWTSQEHLLFLEGIQNYGKDWKRIADLIPSRTVVQTRTHAQKYVQKVAKQQQAQKYVYYSIITKTPEDHGTAANENCSCDLCLICDGYNIPNTCTGRLSSRRCDI